MRPPGSAVALIFPGKVEQRAAYRFLANPMIGVQNIHEPYQEAMAERCRSRPVVLAVQDATMPNYSGLEATESLVDIGGGSGSNGIAAHVGIAFSEGGCALGVFSLDANFRAEDKGKADAGWTPSPKPPTDKEPLDWLPLTTGGEPTKENALRVAGWYERRWLTENRDAAIMTGTRIKDGWLNAADDLRKCLAFDSITACIVMSVERLARSAPDTSARTVVHKDEIRVLAVNMAKPNDRKQRGPPDPDQAIAEFAVNTMRLAGFIPSKRQPLPGTHKLREGYLIPSPITKNYRTMSDDANFGSTVYH